VGFVDDQDGGAAALVAFGGQDGGGLGGEPGAGAVGGAAEGSDDRLVQTGVILSFRVIRRCDLWRPVLDSVADGTLAA